MSQVQTAYYQIYPGMFLKIIIANDFLLHIAFTNSMEQSSTVSPYIQKVLMQLEEYFTGQRKYFQLKYAILHNTLFTEKVYQALQNIPFAQTASYKEIAMCIDNAQAARAVGKACANNPLPVVIPCHRVINSNGTIGNYTPGKEIKYFLLTHESRVAHT